MFKISEDMRMRIRTNGFINPLSDADAFLTDFKNKADEMKKKRPYHSSA